MKTSLCLSKLTVLLALFVSGNGLVAMEPVVQLQPQKKWQYADTIFKFKCVDSVDDEDLIEVPGYLVHYSKSLTLMIDDLGDPATTVPLLHTTKKCFKDIVQALKILINPQMTDRDLIIYYVSLGRQRLVECVLSINFLDIQPLLLPALEGLQRILIQSSADILTWKQGVPVEILTLLKNSALESLNTRLIMCNIGIQQSPEIFTATASNQDGTVFAFGTMDNAIRLVDNNQSIYLQGHTGTVEELKFSPNDQKIASVSMEDETIRLWDIATQQEIIQFKSSSESSSGVQFSSNNNYFACLGNSEDENENYIVINRKTGQRHKLTGIEGFVNEIAVSPDGTHIAIAANHIYLWNTQTQELKVLEIGEVLSMAKVVFSPDGKLLACCSELTEMSTVEIVFWNMVDMTVNTPLSKIITKTVPSNIVFSQDGMLVAFDDGEDVQVFDIQTNALLRRLNGYAKHVHSINFMPNNKYIITTAYGVIRITNISDGKEKKLEGGKSEVIDDIYPIDNTTVVFVDEKGSVYVWDIVTDQLKKLLNMSNTPSVVVISPDKTLIALGFKNGKINVLNIKTGELRVFEQEIASVFDLAFSDDGKLLLALHANGIALLWNTQTGLAQKIVGTHDKIIAKAHSIGDGTLVLVKEKIKNFINLYDITTGTAYTLTDHDNDVIDFAFSSDGHHLICNSEDGMISVWDVRIQKIVKRFKVIADSFDLSPDGNTLAGSNEKNVYLIDLRTNTQQILTTHSNPEENFVKNMLFNADGSLLIINKRNAIELWDMNTRVFKNSIKDPVAIIVRCFFIPNSTLLCIVGEDSVVLWDVYTNSSVTTLPLQCWPQAVNVGRNGVMLAASGVVMPQIGEDIAAQTTILRFNQLLAKMVATLSFEQVFIIARAYYARYSGTSLDLTNSPELLAIFNQIDPVTRALIEQCFKIKTAQ